MLRTWMSRPAAMPAGLPVALRHAGLPVVALSAAFAAAVYLATPSLAQTTPPNQPSAKSRPAPKETASAAQPTLLGEYGDWGAYEAASNGHKVCYALARPQSSRTNPPNKPRDQPYLFISSRPAENVRNEVSVMIGYAFKPGSEATVEIGPVKFALYTQNDGAWIKNAAEEPRMVDAMRKGADLIVTGLSARGTQSTDVFPLKGLTQALDRVAQDCR